MYRKIINAFAVAAAVALGGTALAQQGSSDPQPQQQSQQMQQGQSGQVQGQQGMMGQLKSVKLSSLNNAEVRQIQTHLKDIGLFKGNVDGNLGADTRSALLAYFQNQVTLSQQGRISEGALSGFGFDRAEIERVRGIDQGNVRQPTQGSDMNKNQQQQQPQQQQRQY
jgi:hypothetical protein